ncbi:Brain-enriched guanylate kinase-associated protein [Bagarius yarrelli]|uniref:Brain-enriched guanylate kinase-associated protein n=1 Tax=Bagarius yarrelli TaxID=175774 RepID=A0A556UF97_BAGYA|nr:Brain-enriched guanylate kinase-associated protein [Bagarius yarrelli]
MPDHAAKKISSQEPSSSRAWNTNNGFLPIFSTSPNHLTLSIGLLEYSKSEPKKDSVSFSLSNSSSPTAQESITNLHGPGSTCNRKESTISRKNPASSLQNSLHHLKGSSPNLKRFTPSSSSALKSPKHGLRSSATSFHSSSTSFKSSSSSLQSGNLSEDDSWGTNSWSSGATCLLRSSIKQHSEEVFRVRASSGSRPEPATDSESGHKSLDRQPGDRKSESQKTSEKGPMENNFSVHNQSSSHHNTSAFAHIKEKIEAKIKFSQFLNEVTSRVMDPESLQTFQKETVPIQSSSHSTSSSQQPTRSSFHSGFYGDSLPSCWESKKSNTVPPLTQVKKCTPSWKVLDTTVNPKKAHEKIIFMEKQRRQDNVQTTEDRKKEQQREQTRERRPILVCPNRSQTNHLGKNNPRVVAIKTDSSVRKPDYSSLPKNSNSDSEQKEDLRKQLSFTTHKLEMLEAEFDATKQYLETELRRAQEELEKFTDKLHRIQSSYAALQRINQELEEKFTKKTQQYEEEKRTLGREIFLLKNHLKEAKITIKKLREDNDLYKKDCTSAAQLLQCGKSLYRTQMQTKLPTDFQESSHIDNHGHGRSKGLCHSPYSSTASTVIASVVEKLEPGSSCPVTRSPSPQPQDPAFLANTEMNSIDTLQHHVYKSSDLYRSDTALYCPMDESRQDHLQGRRKSVELHGKNTGILQTPNYGANKFQPLYNNVALNEGFTPGSSPYSTFSVASDEKGLALSSTLSSSHLALYMDWRDGDYECKSTSSYDIDSPKFPKSHNFQHVTSSPQQGNSPVYMRTASCYSEPYYSPRLTSSHNMGSLGEPKESCSSIHIPQEELIGRWRHLSVGDINNFSYLNPGHVSPYSFSENHFGPSKIKLGQLYSRVQEGNSSSHTGGPEFCFSPSPGSSLAPSPKHSMNLVKTERGPVFQLSNNIQKSKNSLFLAGISKDIENTVGNVSKEYVDVSPNSSAESLHQTQLDTSNVQHYKLQRQESQISPQHQKFISTGLSRKDSLTKAQLYGTLLN